MPATHDPTPSPDADTAGHVADTAAHVRAATQAVEDLLLALQTGLDADDHLQAARQADGGPDQDGPR